MGTLHLSIVSWMDLQWPCNGHDLLILEIGAGLGDKEEAV